MKEVDYQKKIIDAVNSQGGYGLKMSNRFLAGVPDLLIHLRPYPTAVVEVKMLTSPVNLDTPMQLGHSITPLQRSTLLRMRKAGLMTGWVGILCGIRGYVSMWVSADTGVVPTKREFEEQCLTKNAKDSWEQLVTQMMEKLHIQTS